VTHVVPGVDPDRQRDVAEQAFGGPVELAEPNRSFQV
jgi:hypothetical protein